MRKYTKYVFVFLSIFLVSLVIIKNHKNIHKNQFRYAPKDDFGYIDINSIKSVSVPTPTPKPSVEKNSLPKTEKVAIYGKNTIRDYYLVKRSLQKLADSTVALVYKYSLYLDTETNTYKPINVTTVGKEYSLDEKEDFYNQKLLSFCSGSLVSKNLVLTAGHCVSDIKEKGIPYFEDIFIVFGWKQVAEENYNLSFLPENVYQIKRVVVRKKDRDGKKDGEDYAILELDKSVKDRSPLILDRDGVGIVEGNKVFTIGYPLGMSVKITSPDDAKIYIIGENTFSTDIDAFGGNSGSPVFDSYTKRVIGILVAGDVRQIEYINKNDVKINFLIKKGITNNIERETAIEIKADKKLMLISDKAFSAVKAYFEYKGIIVDEIKNEIIIPKGIEYYDYELLADILWNLKILNDTGKLYRLPSYKGVGTIVQKINSIIDVFIPLTDYEIEICNKIILKMESMKPIIDPDLMMWYKANRCERTKSI